MSPEDHKFNHHKFDLPKHDIVCCSTENNDDSGESTEEEPEVSSKNRGKKRTLAEIQDGARSTEGKLPKRSKGNTISRNALDSLTKKEREIKKIISALKNSCDRYIDIYNLQLVSIIDGFKNDEGSEENQIALVVQNTIGIDSKIEKLHALAKKISKFKLVFDERNVG